MNSATTAPNVLELLNQALARELRVSIQYMLQHAIGAARRIADPGETQSDKRSKFIGSHSPYWLPGVTLKKVAITEMRHAEAIAERVVLLGGEPTTQPGNITIGATAKAMLEVDRHEESGAIELYRQIIEVAQREQDDVTAALFRKILADEEQHHRVFSALLAEG